MNLKNIGFKKDISPIVGQYILYLFFLGLSHIIMLSVISFFHFLLGHNLGTIQEWIGGQAWGILIFNKLLSLMFFLFFYSATLNEKHEIKGIFKENIWRIDRKAMVSMLGSFFAYLIFIRVQHLTPLSGDFYHFSISFMGVLTIFLVDMAVIKIINKNTVWGSLRGSILAGILSLLFYISHNFIFSYAKGSWESYWIYMFFSIFFLLREPKSMGNIMLFLFLWPGILTAVFGQGVFWPNDYKLLTFIRKTNIAFLIGVFSLMSFYYFKGASFKRSEA